MGEISTELTKFKTTVEPNIGKMNSTCSDLQSKSQELATLAGKVKSEVSGYYTSENQTAVLGRFDKITDVYNKISTSTGSDLKGMLSESEAIITLVTELETINKEIDAQKAIISTNSGTEDSAVQKRTAAQGVITEKNKEFDTKHEDAKAKLEALKGKDASLSFCEEFPPTKELDPEDAQYGRMEKRSFTASNGLTVNYWLYIPDYGEEDVEGLPAMLYMHGGSTHQNVGLDHAVQYGLPSKIKNREVTPSGIVIIPAVCDFTDRGIQALKELTDSVVEEKKCDTNRVSVSGHSYGGITAYKLVNKYPGYWSACVPISGSANVTQSFSDVKTWQFVGSYENGQGNTSCGACQNAVNQINQIGQALITILKTGHAGTNKDTYGNKYMSPDGIQESPLEWAFRQSRA